MRAYIAATDLAHTLWFRTAFSLLDPSPYFSFANIRDLLNYTEVQIQPFSRSIWHLWIIESCTHFVDEGYPFWRVYCEHTYYSTTDDPSPCYLITKSIDTHTCSAVSCVRAVYALQEKKMKRCCLSCLCLMSKFITLVLLIPLF